MPTLPARRQADRAKRKDMATRLSLSDRPLPSAEAGDEYRTKALELINANLNATLEYAWRLANVKSPAEFVELSTKHACGHFKFIMTLPLGLMRF